MPSVVPFVLDRRFAPDDTDQSLLSRPELVEYLGDAARHKICLIHAPTGSGKSVLLSQFYHSRCKTQPLVWLKLNAFDSDPVHFFRHLCSAIRQRVPAFSGFTALQHHSSNSQEQAQLAMNNVLVALQSLSYPLHIIIDNFEMLTAADWLPVIPLLIELSPLDVQWILAGRSTNGIEPLQWELADSFAQLNQAHLFFSIEETERFLASNANDTVDEALTQTLFHYTKGWPAAVKLAQVYLHHKSPSQHPDSTLFGRHIFNTLSGRVLDALSGELRYFLVHVAFLESFSIPLCNHVLNSLKAADHINHLKHLSLFIEPDVQNDTFRFHDLFREQLLDVFRQQPAPVRDRLIARACTWLVEHQQREAACRIARQHSQGSFFIELLRQSFRIWFRAGHAEPVFYWGKQLGAVTLMANPETRFAWSWALTMFGELVQAESTISKTLFPQGSASNGWEQLFTSAQTSQEVASALIFAIIKLFRGEMSAPLIEHLNRLYNKPTLSIDHRASIDNIFAQHSVHHCHFREARQRASQAVHVMEKTGNQFGYSLGMYLIANSCYQNNDIKSALTTCEQYLAKLDVQAGSTARALVEGFHAFLLYQSNQPVAAEQRIHHLLFNHQPGYSIDLQLFLTVPLLRMKTRRGEFPAAHFLLQQLEYSSQASGSHILQAHVAYERIRLAYVHNNRNEIEHLTTKFNVMEMAQSALTTGQNEMQWETRDRWVLAAVLVLLQRGTLIPAQQFCQQLQYLNVDHGYPIRFLPINVCLAFLDHKAGNISAAFRRLNDSLNQADATGMLTGLLDDIPGLDDFVRLAIAQQRIIDPQHVIQLNAIGLLSLPARPNEVTLSAQEHTIASALQQGHNPEDISEKLGMTNAALQWHLQHLLWKLDVTDHHQLNQRTLPSSQ